MLDDVQLQSLLNQLEAEVTGLKQVVHDQSSEIDSLRKKSSYDTANGISESKAKSESAANREEVAGLKCVVSE